MVAPFLGAFSEIFRYVMGNVPSFFLSLILSACIFYRAASSISPQRLFKLGSEMYQVPVATWQLKCLIFQILSSTMNSVDSRFTSDILQCDCLYEMFELLELQYFLGSLFTSVCMDIMHLRHTLLNKRPQ